MIIDLISTSNYVSFNIRLAHVLGLNAAIYLSELININEKAIRKNKVNEDYFSVDRNYIEQRTTICEEEQKQIEDNLSKLDIISKKDKKYIRIDMSILTSIVMSTDEKLISNISSIAKTKKTETKAINIKNELKSYIETTNPELRDAYSDWIDSVFAKQGWMSKKSVVSGQQLIDSYSKRNLDVALKILEVASINAYRDIQWAISSYEENKKKPGYCITNTQRKPEKVELSNTVF